MSPSYYRALRRLVEDKRSGDHVKISVRLIRAILAEEKAAYDYQILVEKEEHFKSVCREAVLKLQKQDAPISIQTCKNLTAFEYSKELAEMAMQDACPNCGAFRMTVNQYMTTGMCGVCNEKFQRALQLKLDLLRSKRREQNGEKDTV